MFVKICKFKMLDVHFYTLSTKTLLQEGMDSTVQYSTVQYSTAQHSTTQHSTAQHSTAQHSTAQHSIAQHNTAFIKGTYEGDSTSPGPKSHTGQDM